jgi:hypothetical protein
VPPVPTEIVPTDNGPVFWIMIAAALALVVVNVPLCVKAAPPLSISIIPAPALTVVPGVCVNATVLLSVRAPPVVKAPRLLMRLASVRLAAPAELPVKMPAVITPRPWLIVSAEVNVTVWPLADTLPARIRFDPGPVVVTLRSPPTVAPAIVVGTPLSSVELPPELSVTDPTS